MLKGALKNPLNEKCLRIKMQFERSHQFYKASNVEVASDHFRESIGVDQPIIAQWGASQKGSGF